MNELYVDTNNQTISTYQRNIQASFTNQKYLLEATLLCGVELDIIGTNFYVDRHRQGFFPADNLFSL